MVNRTHAAISKSYELAVYVIVATLLLYGGTASAQQSSSGSQSALGKVKITIQVALVASDLSLRPVPRHAIEIVTTGRVPKIVAKTITSFSGEAIFNLSPGVYKVRSLEAVAFEGSSYRWDMFLEVNLGADEVVELSNDNAVISLTKRTPSARRAPTVAGEVFGKVSDGVVTIEAEGSSGSGFLVDERGLILTNAHVVSGSRFFVVRLDDKRRFNANLIAQNPTENVGACARPLSRYGLNIPSLSVIAVRSLIIRFFDSTFFMFALRVA